MSGAAQPPPYPFDAPESYRDDLSNRTGICEGEFAKGG
jgi:hypothetical protein